MLMSVMENIKNSLRRFGTSLLREESVEPAENNYHSRPYHKKYMCLDCDKVITPVNSHHKLSCPNCASLALSDINPTPLKTLVAAFK